MATIGVQMITITPSANQLQIEKMVRANVDVIVHERNSADPPAAARAMSEPTGWRHVAHRCATVDLSDERTDRMATLGPSRWEHGLGPVSS
jgi:hypothetical protein